MYEFMLDIYNNTRIHIPN